MNRYTLNGFVLVVCNNCEDEIKTPCNKKYPNKHGFYVKCIKGQLCSYCNRIREKHLCETCLVMKGSKTFNCKKCDNIINIPCNNMYCIIRIMHEKSFCINCEYQYEHNLCKNCLKLCE